MQTRYRLNYRRRPSVLIYMTKALYPSPGLQAYGGRFPPMIAHWHGLRFAPTRLNDFEQLTGLDTSRHLPLLYPQVAGFPLLMALLTHPAFPLPIWNALQIRNHLLQHRPLRGDARYDLQTQVTSQRVLEKGAEVDLHSTLSDDHGLAWESLTTFYFRGRYGEPTEPSPLAASPRVESDQPIRWHMPSGVGRRFGRQTGDYNGIHLSRWYARRLGFPGAFHHPQLVLGQLMTRLTAPEDGSQRLDAWLKGPVFYDIDVELHSRADGDAQHFAVANSGDERPAIAGTWRPVPSGSRLLDPHGNPIPATATADRPDQTA